MFLLYIFFVVGTLLPREITNNHKGTLLMVSEPESLETRPPIVSLLLFGKLTGSTQY